MGEIRDGAALNCHPSAHHWFLGCWCCFCCWQFAPFAVIALHIVTSTCPAEEKQQWVVHRVVAVTILSAGHSKGRTRTLACVGGCVACSSQVTCMHRGALTTETLTHRPESGLSSTSKPG